MLVYSNLYVQCKRDRPHTSDVMNGLSSQQQEAAAAEARRRAEKDEAKKRAKREKEEAKERARREEEERRKQKNRPRRAPFDFEKVSRFGSGLRGAKRCV
jgi:LAS seventeen-binding protein 5